MSNKQDRSHLKAKLPIEIRNAIIKYFCDDCERTYGQIKNLVLDDLNHQVTVSQVGNVIKEFEKQRTRELKSLVINEIKPYIASDFRRLQEIKTIQAAVTNNLFEEHLKDKADTKLTNGLVKSINEEAQLIKVSTDIMGINAVEGNANTIQTVEYDPQHIDTIVDRLAKLDASKQNLN